MNPEREIQPFVVNLTGINSNMLKNAPKFYEVAKRIVEITEDCIVVAHNADFDYRILKTEFNRLGFQYKRKTLCTVELSQELIPDTELFNEEEIAWIKKHPVIHFGYEPSWPPFEIYEKGEYSGISGDYIKMIEIHTEIDMVPIPNITWEETINGLKSGEIKVAAIAGITEQREKYLEFTNPNVIDPLVIVTRSNYKFVSVLLLFMLNVVNLLYWSRR